LRGNCGTNREGFEPMGMGVGQKGVAVRLPDRGVRPAGRDVGPTGMGVRPPYWDVGPTGRGVGPALMLSTIRTMQINILVY
jgi:hypothetical protein